MALRRIGLLSFSDEWLRDLGRARRRAKGHLARALRAAGLAEVDDAVLDELTDPRPDYDVDRLESEQLIDLAEGMFAAARQALWNTPTGRR